MNQHTLAAPQNRRVILPAAAPQNRRVILLLPAPEDRSAFLVIRQNGGAGAVVL